MIGIPFLTVGQSLGNAQKCKDCGALTIECKDGEYSVAVEVQGGKNHAKWKKGDKKMWVQYD